MAIERATITRVVSGGRQVFVEVPKLGLGQEFGPCDVLWAPETMPAVADHTHAASASTTVGSSGSGVASSTGAGGTDGHTHPISSSTHKHSATTTVSVTGSSGTDTEHTHDMPPLKPGMKCIVAPIHDVPDDLVVLGIIA